MSTTIPSTADLEKRFGHFLEKEKGRSKRTITEYQNDIHQFRRFLDLQPVPPSWLEVLPRHIRDFIISLEPHQAKGAPKKEISPHRISRVVSSLQAWFTYLGNPETEGLAITNPAANINKPKLPKRLPKSLELHQITKLLKAANEHSRPSERLRNWALIGFLFGTGLRISEALSLTLETGKSIRFVDSEPVAVVVIGKGNKERIVNLSSTAKRVLSQWLKFRRANGTATNPALWVNTSGRSIGKTLTIRSADHIVRNAGKVAGLGSVSPHKLRHSCGTALAENGLALEVIKDILGHSSVATTQIYVTASQKRLEAAMQSLPDVLDMAV